MRPRRLFALSTGAMAVALGVAAPVVAHSDPSGVSAKTANGWTKVAVWQGGATYACQTSRDDGLVDVSAYWDGRNYPTSVGPDPYARKSGSGGLAFVRNNWSQHGWTYASAAAGRSARSPR